MFKPMTEKERKEFITSRAGTPEHFYLLRELEASKRNNIPFIQDISIEMFKLLIDKDFRLRLRDKTMCQEAYANKGLGMPFKSERDYVTRDTIFCYNNNEVFKSMKGFFGVLLDSLELAWLCVDPLPVFINSLSHYKLTNSNYGYKNARKLSIESLLLFNIDSKLSTHSGASSFIEQYFINNLIKELKPLIEYLEFLEQNGIEKHNDESIELYELNYAN